MAKDNNLQDFLTDIADTIREKKGTTDKINPLDFSSEISSLKVGDSSTIEYLDVRDIGILTDLLAYAALFAKFISDSMSVVAPFGVIYPSISELNGTITHIAVDWDTRIVIKQNDTIKNSTALENILSRGITQEQLDAIPRITKEEFYSL